MTAKNKYANRSKILEAKIRELIRLFALNLDAPQIAVLTGLNRNTVNRFLKDLRERIAQYCEESPLSGEIEVDESFFGSPDGSKRNETGERSERPSSSAFSIETERSIPRSFPTAPKIPFRASFAEKWPWRASSLPTAGEAMKPKVDVEYGKHLRVDHGKDPFFPVLPISRVATFSPLFLIP